MVSKILRADGTTELASIQTVTYHESVNADTDLRPGCVASNYIEVTCFGAQSDAPDVGEALTYYQVVGETETLIGIFFAEPSIPTKNSYSFVAYDAVHKLDADFSAWLSAHQDDFPYTVKQLVEQACTISGVTLGTSSWDHSTMSVNAFYADGITCRNILQYAAEIGCKFVRCHTNGSVYFEWYTTASNKRIYPSSGTSGSETRYAYKQDGLTYDNYDTSAVARVAVHPVGEDEVAYYYPTNVTSGNTLNITNNALLYGASSTDMLSIAQSIYTTMTAFGTYRPMSVEMFPNECPFGCGDIVPVTDAQGVSFTTAIMEKTVTDSAVTLASTGREVYGDYALDTAKKLVQLASDIVRINKLKVGWAEIDEAVVGVLTSEGIMDEIDGANKEEQLIYKTFPSGTSSVSPITTWVTNTGDQPNTWTKKRPSYNANYPVLFVATQRKTVDGTITCTTPLKDDNSTTISGGQITTGTIDASVVNVTKINASNITTGTLSADRIGANSIAVGKLTGSITNGEWKIDLNAGTFTIGKMSANNLTAGTIDASVITVKNIDASEITTGALTVRDANNNIIFQADQDLKTAQIGGFVASQYLLTAPPNGSIAGMQIGSASIWFGNNPVSIISGNDDGITFTLNTEPNVSDFNTKRMVLRFYAPNGTFTDYGFLTISKANGTQWWFNGNTRVQNFEQSGANATVTIGNPSAWRTALGVAPRIDNVGIKRVSGQGQNNYFKIATITITGTYVNRTIAFKLSGRGKRLTTLNVRFASVNGTDPGLELFSTDVDDTYYIRKYATSTWELYGQYIEPWGDAVLHSIDGSWDGNTTTITVNMTNAGTTEPSNSTRASWHSTTNLTISKSSNSNIYLKNLSITAGTAPPSDLGAGVISFLENGNKNLSQIYSYYTTSKMAYIRMIAYNYVGSTSYNNFFDVRVNADGTPAIYMSHPAAWLSALSGAAPTTTSTVSQIISLGSGWTASLAQFATWGKVGMLRMNVSRSTAQSSAAEVTVGTLVAGKRPVINTGGTRPNDPNKTVYITSAGVVSVYGSFAANATIAIVATYILA